MLRALLSQQRAVLGREHDHCMRTMESLTGLLLEVSSRRRFLLFVGR
jgi:hypothetical protein